jgi:hypothetical protein
MNKTDVIYRNHEETELMKLSNIHFEKIGKLQRYICKIKKPKRSCFA